MQTAEDVLGYWLDEVNEADWYRQDDAIDATIRERFLSTWQRAADGHLGLWLTCPSETLAYIILTDQFPRNMFRASGEAFSTDALALAAAKMAIDRDWDLRIDAPGRQFFYLPLMHSENLADQDRAVRLFHTRMPDAGAANLDHARAHRAIIRSFGRFPYRNDALDRPTTAAEASFLRDGGYGAMLRQVMAANA
ncbi:Uncharacterized conserved protein, DUF924 family [Loktanella fryxellensis]|uniref:Uncharacterized conserved protein, DUF924 family n=1 Tax=Loktanella fryxellensis TaxID=245187 RepID=A0A1H7YQ60_9RHOB|nr:DUF924 family protein [Loktanella fryxellensis]SEM48093.1 Uncharacterized conserved protein, DUF924 family [Loktanella fryxellensis]